MSSFCSAKATHIFSAKNIRILYIESAKTVKEMTLNELVKLTTLWTTGPRHIWLVPMRYWVRNLYYQWLYMYTNCFTATWIEYKFVIWNWIRLKSGGFDRVKVVWKHPPLRPGSNSFSLTVLRRSLCCNSSMFVIAMVLFYFVIICPPQQAHVVNTTSPQRPCNVMTLHWRWADVV